MKQENKIETKCTRCGKADYTEAIEFDDDQSFCRSCCEESGMTPVKQENKTDWLERLREEFSIHFQDNPSEMLFLEVFIEELLDKQRKEFIEKMRNGGVCVSCGKDMPGNGLSTWCNFCLENN